MPLRFFRPSMAPVAVGVAAALVVASSVPASADQVRHSEWWLAKLQVTAAQKISQGSGVTIAVLSTGADTSAPDLTGSVTSGPDFSHSGRTQGGPFYGIQGTELASIIAGHGHGPGHAEGVLGVAPDAKIISIRVTLDSGDPLSANAGTTSALPDAIAKGIRFAVANGATVIDLPLDPAAGAPTGTAVPTAVAGPNPAEKAAVAYAISKGALLVAPAGDDAANQPIVNYPAAFPGVISVGAFNSNLVKAAFTSRQRYVTLTAAGVGVPVATPTGYATANSTSAAAAVVTGIAALIRSAFPALTRQQVTKALTSTTRFRHAGGMSDGSGNGVVDATAALAAATATAEPHGRAAGTGAVPRVSPMVPAVASPRASLAHKIERDALLSTAVLLILLVLVVVISLIRRSRRDPYDELPGRPDPAARPLATAGAPRGQPQYLPAPGSGAENGTATAASRSFEPAAFEPTPFAAQPFPPQPYAAQPFPPQPYAAQPAAQPYGSSAFEPSGFGGPAASPFAGQDDTNGQRPLNGSVSGPPANGSFGSPSTAPFPPAAAGGRHGSDAPSRPRPVSGTRSASSRARVSGHPPWEPAAKPDSELPWTAAAPVPSAPPPAPPPPVQPAPAAPPGSAWATQPTPAEAIWDAPGIPGAPSGTGRREFTGAQDLSPGGQRQHVWHQPEAADRAESTEAFPAYPTDDF